MQDLYLLHLDTARLCQVPLTGLLPFERRNTFSTAVMRIPVHVLRGAASANGEVLYGQEPPADAGPAAEEVLWNSNPSTTIIEWRTVVVVAFGCSPHSAGQSASIMCAGQCPTSASLLCPFHLRCASPQGLREWVVVESMFWI